MTNLFASDATRLRQSLLDRTISPDEIVQDLFSRIKRINPIVQCWEYTDPNAVSAQLNKIATYDPKEASLWGIPIGVKDIYNTYDMPTQMGSPIWKDFTPGNDARIVHYLRRNGAIMLGKTVTAEFAVHYQDKTRNPHDLNRSPGTSSSGSAVAVATGTVPLALGSQTAGSIGRPASYCGIYGFKPTFGILPRIGVLKTTDSLDTLGFFTRSVDDLSLLFEASRVHGQNYEFVHRHIDGYHSDPKRPFRVGIVRHPKWGLASEYAKNAFEQWYTHLQDARIVLEHAELPDYCATIHDIHETIYDRSLAYYFKDEYARHELMSPLFYEIIQKGESITKEKYLWALERQADETSRFDHWMESYDLLITLAAADEAPIGLTTPDIQDSNLIWTYLGLPVATIPVLKGPNGLPIGVNVVAKKYNDKLLLDFLDYLSSLNILRVIQPVDPIA